jgi:RNA polymerase sigma factor for flagellar operon FliA
VEIRELRERVRDLVQGLPEQERFVVYRHYLQQQPFDDICTAMKLTKGRVSQIHRRALLRLREWIRPSGGLDLRL